MSEREQPVGKDQHGEWIGNAECLSQLNSLLRRIQETSTSANANQPKSANGSTPPAGQSKTNK